VLGLPSAASVAVKPTTVMADAAAADTSCAPTQCLEAPSQNVGHEPLLVSGDERQERRRRKPLRSRPVTRDVAHLAPDEGTEGRGEPRSRLAEVEGESDNDRRGAAREDVQGSLPTDEPIEVAP
jgi:hypothetical protein